MAESVTSPRIVEGTLFSREFKAAVSDVARFTVEQKEEAGFVVYGTPNAELSISDMAHGTTSIDYANGSLTPRVEFNHLLFDRSGRVRKDILVMLHSHPDIDDDFIPDEALKSLEAHQEFVARTGAFADAHKRNLFPSVQDMALYSNVNKSNPGHIGSTLVTDRELTAISLLLYRHTTPIAPVSDPHQALASLEAPTVIDMRQFEGKVAMLKAMEGDSYRIVEMGFDPRRQIYAGDIGSLVLGLF